MAPPLSGLTILNTREASAAGKLTRLLAQEGAVVLEQPTIAFAPPESWEPFDAALNALQPGDWVVFSSPTAVRFTLARGVGSAPPRAKLAAARLAAVGQGTAQVLRDAGLPVTLVPGQFQSEGLLAALLPHLNPGSRVWQPRAAEARPVLEAGMAAAGMKLIVTPVYRTVVPAGGLGVAAEPLRRGKLDWIVFTSGSTATNLLHMADAETRAAALAIPVACLGRVTAEVAEKHGFSVAVVPGQQSLEGLVAAMREHVAAERGVAPPSTRR